MTPRSAATAATAAKKAVTPKAVGRASKKTAAVKRTALAKKQMAAKKPVAARAGGVAAKKVKSHPHPAVAYRLHALLHTMHSIEHHEDHLCTLLTAIEREGAVSPAVRKELAALLEELPSQAFVADLEAARRALATSAGMA